MKKEYYLQTYDENHQTVILDRHRDYYEPFGLFTLCLFIAQKINKELYLGVTCFRYDPVLKTSELMFDIEPKIQYLETIKKLFEPHDV